MYENKYEIEEKESFIRSVRSGQEPQGKCFFLINSPIISIAGFIAKITTTQNVSRSRINMASTESRMFGHVAYRHHTEIALANLRVLIIRTLVSCSQSGEVHLDRRPQIFFRVRLGVRERESFHRTITGADLLHASQNCFFPFLAAIETATSWPFERSRLASNLRK